MKISNLRKTIEREFFKIVLLNSKSAKEIKISFKEMKILFDNYLDNLSDEDCVTLHTFMRNSDYKLDFAIAANNSSMSLHFTKNASRAF